MTSQAQFSACPHLGLEEDRNSVYMRATPAHCCFIRPQVFSPDEAHQESFCLQETHVDCPLYSPTAPVVPARALPAHRSPDAAGQPRRVRRFSLPTIAATAFVLVFLIGLTAFLIGTLRPTASEASTPAASATVSGVGVVSTPGTPTPTTAASGTPAEITDTSGLPAELLPTADVRATPAVDPEDSQVTLQAEGAIWWLSDDRRLNYRSDSFLYAGSQNGKTYISAAYFDLEEVPRGTPIRQAALELTGLRANGFDPSAQSMWIVQLIAEPAEDALEPDVKSMLQTDFAEASTASASPPLFPNLGPSDLAVGKTNRWELDAAARSWLERQLINEQSTIYVRIMASTLDSKDTLFAWDSGIGSASSGAKPQLLLNLGPSPTEPPPTPTPIYTVATLQPTPRSIYEAATRTALAQQAQSEATTPTPFIQVFTPTPVHKSVETAQAVALLLDLPAVVVDTPVPRSPYEATEQANYATVMAAASGTATPLPTEYVTPVWVSPTPTAANTATAIARENNPAPAPELPHNAIEIEYLLATPTPENAATAVAQAEVDRVLRERFGPPTPFPFHVRIITETPTPLPTATPTTPLVIPGSEFTPTPTALPTELIPTAVPADFRGKILFLSDRNGGEDVFSIDPETGEIAHITRRWVHDVAREQYLAYSPDRSRKALVEPDEALNQTLQIKLYSFQYNDRQRVTQFNVDSYDPAWSPLGDRIAFVSTEAGNDEIYTVDINGENVQRLTYTEGVWEKHPSWSPDGSKLVFYSNRTTNNQLWIMNADGSAPYNLSKNAFNDTDPVWVR